MDFDEQMLKLAHKKSIFHRTEIEASTICGCFFCLGIFSPSKIEDWIDEENGKEETAICPYCGVDSVIGNSSGYPIDQEFLAAMERRWFGLRK